MVHFLIFPRLEFTREEHCVTELVTSAANSQGFLIRFKFIKNFQVKLEFKLVISNFASSSSSSVIYTEFDLSSSSFYWV